MSGLKIRWGGATVAPSQVKVRAGGVWVNPAAVWVRASGAWVKVWPNIAVYLANMQADDAIPPPGPAGASITMNAGGYAYENATSVFQWLKSGAASDYDVMFSAIAGATPSGSATGSWLNLGTTRSWSLSQSVGGRKYCTGTLSIRPAGGGATLATCTVSITAEIIV